MMTKGLQTPFLALFAALGLATAPLNAGPQDGEQQVGPGAAPKDTFHPGGPVDVDPLYGGRAIVHIPSLP